MVGVKREFVFNATRMRERRRALRRKSTDSEQVLWDEIRNGKSGAKFKRQYSIGNYVADFFCKSKKLVIEIDGDVHKSTKTYDRYRDRYMESMKITVMRIKNEEVMDDPEKVIGSIRDCLTKIEE